MQKRSGSWHKNYEGEIQHMFPVVAVFLALAATKAALHAVEGGLDLYDTHQLNLKCTAKAAAMGLTAYDVTHATLPSNFADAFDAAERELQCAPALQRNARIALFRTLQSREVIFVTPRGAKPLDLVQTAQDKLQTSPSIHNLEALVMAIQNLQNCIVEK